MDLLMYIKQVPPTVIAYYIVTFCTLYCSLNVILAFLEHNLLNVSWSFVQRIALHQAMK
ncbi:hypothetical protein BY458DRAFT_516648 [Sporodiniella umbellata]|nr:hypothetical protein BY458DRAFT_516648 [Sporodiniella umbellata]